MRYADDTEFLLHPFPRLRGNVGMGAMGGENPAPSPALPRAARKGGSAVCLRHHGRARGRARCCAGVEALEKRRDRGQLRRGRGGGPQRTRRAAAARRCAWFLQHHRRQQAGRRGHGRVHLRLPACGRRALLLHHGHQHPHQRDRRHQQAELPRPHAAQHPDARVRGRLGARRIADRLGEGSDRPHSQGSFVPYFRFRHRTGQPEPHRDRHAGEGRGRRSQGGEDGDFFLGRRGHDRGARRPCRRVGGHERRGAATPAHRQGARSRRERGAAHGRGTRNGADVPRAGHRGGVLRLARVRRPERAHGGADGVLGPGLRQHHQDRRMEEGPRGQRLGGGLHGRG